MSGNIGVLSFSVVAQEFPANLTGRSSTGLNLMIFATAFALQWGMGEIISLWPTAADGGYAVSGYQMAFGIALGLQAVALAWMVVARRFYPRTY